MDARTLPVDTGTLSDMLVLLRGGTSASLGG